VICRKYIAQQQGLLHIISERVTAKITQTSTWPNLATWQAQVTASAFNWPDQYATSSDNYHAEIAVFCLATAMTTTGTHCALMQKDGQVKLVWVADYIIRQISA